MQANWYFDFVSPFSYMQLPRIRHLQQRVNVHPVPIVLGFALKAHHNIAPTEVPPKRAFAYRFIQWQAEQAGLPLHFPPAHPFNSIPALRLLLAAGGGWDAIQMIFEHFWKHGLAGDKAEQLLQLGQHLGIANVAEAITDPAVKAALQHHTEQAIAAGIFGVPTIAVGQEHFWGNDATAMFEDWLQHPQHFDTETYRRLQHLPMGIGRSR